MKDCRSRWNVGLVVGTVLAAACFSLMVRAQRGSVERPMPLVQRARKTRVPVTAVSLASLPDASALDLNRSMKARRELAWDIVQNVWTLVGPPGAQVPAWMTWYEQDDLEHLF